MKTKEKRKRKPLTDKQKAERAKKRLESSFKRKIRDAFNNMGFVYLQSANKDFKIGNRLVELDYVFIFENIIIICEDTCKKDKDIGHIRTKSESYEEIIGNKSEFKNWLKDSFIDKDELINKYNYDRLQIYYIYISMNELELTDDEKARYSKLHFWEPETLAYFSKVSQCIYQSARRELFRFLDIKNEQIGHSGSSSSRTEIKAPIIYPEDAMGIHNNVRIVSFMMSADSLLRVSYVLRKDNWEESMWLYQRLVEKEKIKGIRAFLARKGISFYNNVIVGLPDTAKFQDESGSIVEISRIGDFQSCTLLIPDEMNTVCIIDGQHRIYAYYEAPKTEKYENDIAPLRKQLHLLVTGLVFPHSMKEAERKRIQSEIFLEINSNAKMVPADVLLHIDMLRNPLSDVGIARRVVEKLNNKSIFLKKFSLSNLDEGKIKIASIIKFALRYLVTIAPADGKNSLYKFWGGNKIALAENDENELNYYIEFCAKTIDLYFSAVRNSFKDEWNDPFSKILSTISINGFIIAFTRQLGKNGIMDFSSYDSKLGKLSISFSKDDFPYTSSQYRKFSTQILIEAFGFSDEEANAS